MVPDALLAWLRRAVAAAISHAADSTPRLRASFTLRSPEQFTQPMHPTQSTQRYGSVIALAERRPALSTEMLTRGVLVTIQAGHDGCGHRHALTTNHAAWCSTPRGVAVGAARSRGADADRIGVGDPAGCDEVHRSAQAVADLLSQAGFGDVRIVSEGGAPAVIAHIPHPPVRPPGQLTHHGSCGAAKFAGQA